MAGSTSNVILLRLKWRLAFGRWETKLARWVEAAKAGFDPNQPRVPAGNPDGGQWTGTGGSSGGTGQVLSDATPDNLWKPGARVAQAGPKKPEKPAPQKPRVKLPVPRKPQRGGPPLEPPPPLPSRRPPTGKARIGVAKEAVRWLARALAGRYIRPALLMVEAIEKTEWLDEFIPFIQSAFDPPKSLEQLQRDAATPASGYDIHHIVEQTPARNAGFPESMINAPENRVRIPRIKHWQINSWYGTKNEDFDGLSPREYLRDKDWKERFRIGLDALIEHEVLK